MMKKDELFDKVVGPLIVLSWVGFSVAFVVLLILGLLPSFVYALATFIGGVIITIFVIVFPIFLLFLEKK